jgi:hypothetical protein
MIIEHERGMGADFVYNGALAIVTSPETTQSQSFSQLISRWNTLHSNDTHYQLRNDLVKHLWSLNVSMESWYLSFFFPVSLSLFLFALSLCFLCSSAPQYQIHVCGLRKPRLHTCSLRKPRAVGFYTCGRSHPNTLHGRGLCESRLKLLLARGESKNSFLIDSFIRKSILQTDCLVDWLKEDKKSTMCIFQWPSKWK